MSIRRQGLTLLEVLAAFMIFSIVFTVLVGSSQTAVRSQGLSLRRLAANELADAAMAELEIPMARRELPVIGEGERQEEIFTVRTRQSDFAPEASGDATGGPAGLAGLDAAAMLALQMPEVARFVQRYDVEVEWLEAGQPQRVQRTTFAFDWTGARETYAELFTAAGATLGEGAPGGEEGGSEAGTGTSGGSGTSGDGRSDSSDSRSRGSSGSPTRDEPTSPRRTGPCPVDDRQCVSDWLKSQGF